MKKNPFKVRVAGNDSLNFRMSRKTQQIFDAAYAEVSVRHPNVAHLDFRQFVRLAIAESPTFRKRLEEAWDRIRKWEEQEEMERQRQETSRTGLQEVNHANDT